MTEVFHPFYLEDVIPGILIGFLISSIYSFVDFFLVQSGFRTANLLEDFFRTRFLYMCSRLSNWGLSRQAAYKSVGHSLKLPALVILFILHPFAFTLLFYHSVVILMLFIEPCDHFVLSQSQQQDNCEAIFFSVLLYLFLQNKEDYQATCWPKNQEKI